MEVKDERVVSDLSPDPDLTDELVECWLNYLVMEGEDGQCAVNL